MKYCFDSIPDSSINENSSNIFCAAINDYFSDVDDNDTFLEDISATSNGDVTTHTSSDCLFLSSHNFVGFDTLIVSVADDSGLERSIYNLLGQMVAILVAESQNAGSHQVEWNASGYAGGVYYYHLKASEFQEVKKMILLR
jgi:hypothetical protein